MIAGTEKLKLVRELGIIRKSLPEVAGVNKLTLVKRVREIRQLLSVSSGEPTVSLSIDPSNPIESLKSLTDYVKNGLADIPEALRGVEADIVGKIYHLLPVERNDEHKEAREGLWDALSDAARGNGDKTQGEWMIAAFDHFKSSGKVFDVDVDVINATEESIRELTAKPAEELSPEIAEQMKVAQEEYEKLRLSLTSLISVNEANGFSADEINKASDEFESISLKKQSVWDKLIGLDRQRSEEKKRRIKELKDSITPIGQKVIDTLLNASKVTKEQADSWASNQIIEKSAIAKLKKMGYPEADVRHDMAEFYRITGGKLRLVRIETNGSRRANAGGIGHFEDSVIRPGSAFGKTVLWHEMAHHLEADPVAVSASNGYLLKRRKNEKVHSLRSLTHNPGYRSNEGAYDDNFIDPYIGKVYQNRITEVWSMGVQYLATPQDAAMMVAKDPEMAALMAGYLQADLTPAMKALQTIQDSAKDKAQEKREQVKSEYEQALDKLSAGVEIVDDGWFSALDSVDQENLLSKWSGLADPNAKFIGSWGGYHVFTGKFKNVTSRRMGNGYGVVYTELKGSFVYPDDPGRRSIPGSTSLHGDMRDLKAFLRIASMNNDNVIGVRYNIIGREDKVVEVAKKLSSEQS